MDGRRTDEGENTMQTSYGRAMQKELLSQAAINVGIFAAGAITGAMIVISILNAWRNLGGRDA